MQHREIVVDQFTQQVAPFSAAPSIRDERALEMLVDAACVRPTDRVLDVACGPGLVVNAFAKVVAHATGIDLTPAMIERAGELAAEQGLTNVSWHVGDAVQLPFKENEFDAVVTRYSFHHLLVPQRVLAEMRRVCKPRGTIVVCDAVASDDWRKADAFNDMERLRDPSTVRFRTLAELEGLFLDAGLPRPRASVYGLVAELEGLMKVSFPDANGAAAVREMILQSLQDDSLGLGTHRRGDKICFAYPTVILAAPNRTVGGVPYPRR